jgi:hypothetical protein
LRIVQPITRLYPRVLDGALAVALSVGVALQLLSEEPGQFTEMVWVIGTCLPLVLRRRYPIVCHALHLMVSPISGGLKSIWKALIG